MSSIKQGKKVAIILIFISLIVICFLLSLEKGRIIPSHRIVKYSKDELTDLYWKYQNELNEVAEIIIASNSFRQSIRDSNDIDRGISTEATKQYFSEDEWNKIVDLFQKICPLMIMLSLRNGDRVVYINFGLVKEKNYYISTSLYYFKNPYTAERYKEYIFIDSLEHLDGYWYIGENIIED